jgi:hypothetical protein
LRQSVLFSNSRSARVSFSQVQRVFIVEHYLASCSYSTCQNEFRDTFPDSPVQNKSTISRLVNRFRDTGSVQKLPGCIKLEEKSECMHRWRRWTFQHLFFFFWFQCNLFFDKRIMCLQWVAWLFDDPIYHVQDCSKTVQKSQSGSGHQIIENCRNYNYDPNDSLLTDARNDALHKWYSTVVI